MPTKYTKVRLNNGMWIRVPASKAESIAQTQELLKERPPVQTTPEDIIRWAREILDLPPEK